MPTQNLTGTHPFTSTLRLSTTLIKVGLRLHPQRATSPVEDSAPVVLATHFIATLLILAGVLVQLAVTPAAFLQARDRGA